MIPKPDKRIPNIEAPSVPVLRKKNSPFPDIDQLIADYQEKLANIGKIKNYIPVKRSLKRKKELDEKIFKDISTDIEQSEKDEIIKIANAQKEEEIMLSKTNEMLNENIKNLKDIGEEEEEEINIMNEKNIEDPKEKEINTINENKIEDPKEEEIDTHGDFAEEENNNKRTETVATLNINEIINIKNDLVSSTTISKEDNLEYNSLYNSFILVSFSKKIQFSDYYINIKADCAHEDCNGLPAIKPEIIYKYQLKKNEELHLDSKSAEALFPNGIKLCYEENVANIKPIKKFFPIYTASNTREKFYGFTYYFYIKKEISEFEKENETTPIKQEILDYKKELKTNLNKDDINYILKRLKVLEKLQQKKYVYIPYCACLITKYPLVYQMEKTIENIVNVICYKNESFVDITEFFSYMVDSIYPPPAHSAILFPLAFQRGNVKIKSCNFQGLNVSFDPSFLLTCMRKSHILLILKMLLLEKKILIVGKDNAAISRVIVNFLNLLYPFEWMGSCVSVLSESMLNLLENRLNFIYGINIDLFKEALCDIKLAKDIYIFYLDEKKFDLSANLINENNKHQSVQEDIKKNVTSLPKEKDYIKLLEPIEKNVKSNVNKGMSYYDFEMRNLFMQFIVELIFDFRKCCNTLDQDILFNKVNFINKLKDENKPFFEKLVLTQSFGHFVKKYALNLSKEIYFNKRISDIKEVKNTQKSYKDYIKTLLEKLTKDYNVFNKTKYEYKIAPFCQINKEVRLKEDVEDKRFYASLREFPEYDNDPEKLKVYLIPGQEKKEKKIQETERIGIIKTKEDIDNKNISYLRYGHNLTEGEEKELENELKQIIKNIYMNPEYVEGYLGINMINYFNTKQGRNKFFELLMENHKGRIVQEFGNASFNAFMHIFTSIVAIVLPEENEKNEENLIYLVKLLKLSQTIGTIEKKGQKENHVTLSDKIYSGLEKSPLIYKQRFWEIWIEDSMPVLIKIKNKGEAKKEDMKFNSENYAKYKKELVYLIKGLIPDMLRMKMGENSIYSLLNNLENKYIKDKSAHKIIVETFLDLLQLYKFYLNK